MDESILSEAVIIGGGRMSGIRLDLFAEEEDDETTALFVILLGLMIEGANGVCPGLFPIILWVLLSLLPLLDFDEDAVIFGSGLFLRPRPPPEEVAAKDRAERRCGCCRLLDAW